MNRRNLLAALVGLIGLGLTRAAQAKERTLSTLGGGGGTSGYVTTSLATFITLPQPVRKQYRCSAGHAWVADDYGDCVIPGGYGVALQVNEKSIIFGGGEKRLCIPCLERVLTKMGVGEVTSEPL